VINSIPIKIRAQFQKKGAITGREKRTSPLNRMISEDVPLSSSREYGCREIAITGIVQARSAPQLAKHFTVQPSHSSI